MHSFHKRITISKDKIVMRLLFKCLLLFMLRSEVDAVSCPVPFCKCVFEEKIQDNMATCLFGDSTVNIAWSQKLTQQILTITCQGTNFTSCANLPQFNINDSSGKVVVEECAPSIMRCINGMYSSPSTITTIDVRKLSGEYTGEDFSSFDKLDVLYMRLTETDKQLPAVVLNSLPLLQHAFLMGGDLQLHSNVFNQSRIYHFHLGYNNIKSIPAGAFNGLTSLKELSIEGNNIEKIDRGSFEDLNKLKDLIVSKLTMTSLDPDVFLAAENLTYLYLADMQLQNFPNGFLERFKKIEMVTIKGNQLEMKLGSEAFARLPVSVQDVVISDCKLTYLPETLFKGSGYLEDLTISHNKIEALPPKLFDNLNSLRTVSLVNNSIKILSKEIFSKTTNLITINLSLNNIEKVNGDVFEANNNMRYLFLHTNNISYVDINAFKGMNYLRVIDLSSNKLKRITNNKTITWQTRRLNLNNNQLSEFENWFVQINGLINLNLAHNQIKQIKETNIYSFKAKITIDLRYNNISQIIRNNASTELMIPKRNYTIYLSNNPLECDCLVLTILNDWKDYGILADYDEIICVNIGKLSSYSRKQVGAICSKEHALVALIGTSTIGALVLIILIISIYTRRKKLSDYITIIRNKNNTEIITAYEMKLYALKKYDLFISFAHQDAEFVTDELLVKLETEFGQKVCVHYRDWIVGHLIPDQIVESVESSRLTIIILTEHFLVSEWSYLEFRTAHNLSIQEGKPRVIVILLDETVLQHENLSDDLKSYIAANTYLLWGDIFFWDKLQNVIPRRGRISKKVEKQKRAHALLRCGC